MKYIIILISAFFFLIAPGGAADSPTEARLKSLYNEFRCPTCQGLSVKDSEAGFSVQIRNKIGEMVAAGASDEMIREYFVKRYGVWILRSPPKEGFNLLLWGLPAIGIVLGLLLLYVKSKKWVQKEQETIKGEPDPLTAEEQQLLDSDMKRFENS
ncbi:MAG: cytochrome c-type biogenesis protein CcmH [SAR324 cluster bacterium]|nr:cytochrome c-type biogenesis protein CcmH [SAR324 cluster bacterium]